MKGWRPNSMHFITKNHKKTFQKVNQKEPGVIHKVRNLFLNFSTFTNSQHRISKDVELVLLPPSVCAQMGVSKCSCVMAVLQRLEINGAISSKMTLQAALKSFSSRLASPS
ncbi:hypothetical protein AMECASPLE_029668 [Ameca splendens]|uniref:Uncharacterized protein n=1 Tax=Ameca splendens TaxID=208324 RepID=A0ABV1A2M3_9TELE